MCEANAYIIREGKEELVMEGVDLIEPEGELLKMVNIFGEQKILPVKIKRLALVDHKILLEENKV
jgi:predicted RNA-binding protein